MPFFITHYAIGFICPALLAFFIAGSILFKIFTEKNFQKDKINLSIYFIGAGIYNTLNFFGFSIYSPEAQIIWYLQSFSIFFVIFIINFAYLYPENIFKIERNIALAMSLIISIVSVAHYFISCADSPILLYGHTYGAEHVSRLIPLFITGFYLWSASVFFRKYFYYKNQTTQNGTCSYQRVTLYFGLLIISDVIHSITVYSVMNNITVSAFLIAFITAILVLCIYSLYGFLYLTTAYGNVPFIYKLTAIPIIIFMFIITSSGYLMSYMRSISYDEMNWNLILSVQDIKATNKNAFDYIALFDNSDRWKVIYKARRIFQRL